MTLSFANHVPGDTISVVFAYLDERCAGNYRKEGYYVAGPGDTVGVWTGDCASLNSLWYFWAESTKGLLWQGDSARIAINSYDPFSQGVWDNVDTDRTVGLVEFDIGSSWNCTVNLWSPSRGAVPQSSPGTVPERVGGDVRVL